jgi:hypothetical protein
MKILRSVSVTALTALAATLGLAMTAGSAHADASCTSLIASKTNTLQQSHGWYNFEITVTKDPLADVTYSFGTLALSGSYLYGTADLAFSDRFNGNQGFNVNATEQIQLWVSPTGQVWIWNNNYHYYIVSGVDMTCNGGLISKYVPGLGMVTVAIRGWNAPIG